MYLIFILGMELYALDVSKMNTDVTSINKLSEIVRLSNDVISEIYIFL